MDVSELPKKACAYMRVSTPGQQEGDGFSRQQRVITAFANRHGIEIKRYFRECESGKVPLKERSDWHTCAAFCELQKVNLVLVENTSRLARDLIQSEVALGDCREKGVIVFDVATKMDLTCTDGDPGQELIRRILAALDEYQRKQLIARCRHGLMRRVEQGLEWPHPPSFGEHSEKEADALKFMLKHKHKGPAWIARELNKRGFRNRNGDEYTLANVYKFMRRRGWRAYKHRWR